MKWVVGTIAVIAALAIGLTIGWALRGRADAHLFQEMQTLASPPRTPAAPPPIVTAQPPVVVEKDPEVFAWPLTAADDVVAVDPTHFLVRRSVVQGTLGPLTSVRMIPAFVDGGMRGVKLFGVRAGSTPSKLGLQNGDTVETINGVEASPVDVYQAFANAKEGTTFSFGIERRDTHIALHYRIAP